MQQNTTDSSWSVAETTYSLFSSLIHPHWKRRIIYEWDISKFYVSNQFIYNLKRSFFFFCLHQVTDSSLNILYLHVRVRLHFRCRCFPVLSSCWNRFYHNICRTWYMTIVRLYSYMNVMSMMYLWHNCTKLFPIMHLEWVVWDQETGTRHSFFSSLIHPHWK